MTLDDSAFASFVKGHFCSVLLSNIIGYLRFYSIEQIPYWIWISLPFCIFLRLPLDRILCFLYQMDFLGLLLACVMNIDLVFGGLLIDLSLAFGNLRLCFSDRRLLFRSFWICSFDSVFTNLSFSFSRFVR